MLDRRFSLDIVNIMYARWRGSPIVTIKIEIVVISSTLVRLLERVLQRVPRLLLLRLLFRRLLCRISF